MTVGERDPAEWPLGVRLEAAMKARQWSGRRLSEEAGVSAQLITNLLKGYKAHKPDEPWRPAADKVRAVAHALDQSEDEWLRLAGHEVPDRPAIEGVPTEQLATLIGRLDVEEQRALEILVGSILRSRGYVATDEPVVKSVSEGAHGGVRSHEEAAHGVEAPESARD